MCLFSSTVICSRCVLHEGALKGCSLPKNDRRERRADGQYSCATKAAKLNWAAEIIRSSKHVLTLSLGHEQHTGAEPGGRGSPLHYSETNSTRWERNVVFVEWFLFATLNLNVLTLYAFHTHGFSLLHLEKFFKTNFGCCFDKAMPESLR